eukprot:scaffold4497_cov34-Tisochrysis_lutea.AAC.1
MTICGEQHDDEDVTGCVRLKAMSSWSVVHGGIARCEMMCGMGVAKQSLQLTHEGHKRAPLQRTSLSRRS